jgi:uncharacterized protein (DUF1330 family)
MTAYMIMDIDVLNPSQYETYKREVPRLVEKYGGEYLVRGGEFEIIEGEWNPVRFVIIRFPDRQAIRALFADPEYQPLKLLRHKISTGSIVAVDGL